MPAIAFPASSTPGRLPGEGEGRLINAYFEKAGDTAYWRRVPGLTSVVDTAKSGPRGLIDVAGVVYAAFAGCVVKVAADGTVTTLAGALPGTKGVTFAHNNRVTAGVSTPDLVAVCEDGGAFLIDLVAGTVSAYPDASLPATVNSVEFLGGYFLFSIPDGRMFASGLNDVWVSDSDHTQNALSYATAESSADGLLRGIVANGRYNAMGSETIEFWLNVGNTPFPLGRATTVVSVGLLTTMAVAGFGEGWDRDPIFVAHDGTVRSLVGYSTSVISTPDVENFIAKSTIGTIEASAYTFRGKAMWCVSSDQGTWEYEVAAQAWHERWSVGATRWRGSRAVKSNGRWLTGDTLSGKILAIGDGVRTEAGQPLTWTLESSPSKAYPARIEIPSAFFDFTPVGGSVNISWSLDGGSSWSSPITRSMASARDGVEVNRLGLATHHGLRVRLAVSDDVDFAFIGGSVPAPQPRAP